MQFKRHLRNVIKIEESELKLYTFLQNYTIFYKIDKFSIKIMNF